MTKFFVAIISLLVCLSLAVPVLAQNNLTDGFGSPLDEVGNKSGFDTSQRDVDPIIGNIITVVLSFVGVLFLALMVYGGYMWMTAAGNEERAKKARELIIAAVIGILVVVAAYAITAFVLERLVSPTIKPA